MYSKDCKQSAVATLATIVSVNVLEALIHDAALAPIYHRAHYAALWNPPDAMRARMPATLAASVVFSWAFVAIYARGYEEEKPALGQGLRYGLLAGLLSRVAPAMVEFMVYPVSWRLAAAWCAAGLVECALLGMIAASLYHPHKEAI